MAKKGFFILTDISGCTEFLTKSELDHAQDALQGLFDAQLAYIKHPFVISGFRGDAIFMYVPETNFCTPQTLLESLENLYFIFADTRRQMIFNTTCTCRACKNISRLDLKMVIHFGEYAIQKLGDREELLGADVIVPHRMLKNHVIEQTGVESYALFSEVAAEALNLSELAYPLVPHTEAYEHIGEVNMQVLDLHKVWEREQEKKRIIVQPDKAWITLESDIPYPPSVVWEYSTVPDNEQAFVGYDMIERIDEIGGRMQTETATHCAHAAVHFYRRILDWKPFEYYTDRTKYPNGVELIRTAALKPIEIGTHLAFYYRKPENGGTDEFRRMVIDSVNSKSESFLNLIKKDIDNGKLTIS